MLRVNTRQRFHLADSALESNYELGSVLIENKCLIAKFDSPLFLSSTNIYIFETILIHLIEF